MFLISHANYYLHASRLSESNPAAQFRAVFQAKMGHSSHFLVKNQVKVAYFYGKSALSDKLLDI